METSPRPPPLPPSRILFVLSLFLLSTTLSLAGRVAQDDDKGLPPGVTYDARSLIIHGKRELILSGSIHYPRLTEDKWEDVLTKSRDGGINCIQTYVFWNVNEPRKGQFDFTGNYDIVRFIKMVGEHGMYATLRVGPFIQAEWNHGGLPYWLREEPGVIFRTDNPAYKREMQRWVTQIVNMMKEANLFASQGGPIILAQIENEYDHIMEAFDESGERYIKWAGDMALNLKIGVPWLMCKQQNAPGEVIDACNGRHCGDTFSGPNSPTKPKLWTENWTAQFRVFGDPPSQRPAEDIAYSVARWFSKNGTHVNYYMYFGGTNFGRTSAAYITTRYYDEAPIDEFGFLREPKYGHLRDIHYALQLGKTPILYGSYSVQPFGPNAEARVYEIPEKKLCAAFLWNNDTRGDANINFRGTNIRIPPKSISLLPDCKTVVYNTNTIVSQHSARVFEKSEIAHKGLKWEMYTEMVPTSGHNFTRQPLEQYFLSKDTTDYIWYITNIELDNNDLPNRKSIQPVLQILSLGHGILAFVNGKFAGTSHGIKRAYHFDYDVPVLLKEGMNQLAFLQYTVGMPDSGAYMEHRYTGLRTLVVQGLGTGNLDLTKNGWHHRIGLDGEEQKLFTEEGAKKVSWVQPKGVAPPLTWFKATFDAPGDGPLAIQVDNMTKGMIWVNGRSIGRYWTTFHSPLKKSSQTQYHIPRLYLKPKDNFIVIFDEAGGLIDTVEIQEVHRNQKCSLIGESYPPNVYSWKRSKSERVEVREPDLRPKAELTCPKDHVVLAVEFASFGNPWGICGLYKIKECHSPLSQKIVEEHCLGKPECKVPVDRKLFQLNECPNEPEMTLAVQVKCGIKV